jgi:hypothetical protein
MADDITAIIRDLRKEAIERCRKRIVDAAQNLGKKPRKPEQDYGIMSMIKRQHGL